MTDTKLREKAAALIAFTQLGPRFIEWVQAVTEALAPAPEKAAEVECPNCKQQIAGEHNHRIELHYPGHFMYRCQRQQTEHEDSEFLRAGAAAMARIIERDEQPEPAAPEMPEAIENAATCLLFAPVGKHIEHRAARTALLDWWRNLAQPVAVGMTPELERVLEAVEAAERDARIGWVIQTPRSKALEADIAAVRAQAAQGRKVEFGKARKMLEYMRRCAWHEETYQQIEEALAELDAAEGKVAG